MRLLRIKYFLKSKLILILLFSSCVYGQKKSKSFKINSGKTIDVIKQVEKAFDIYYSYSDSIMKEKYIYSSEGKVTINDFHKMLASQNNLKVIAINKRLYSIINNHQHTKIETLKEVIVTGYLINTLTKDSKKVVLKSFNTQVLPGITDFDVLRAFQQLPGIKSPNQTVSGLYVKGGSPDQNALLWNNIRIYHPGHLFGMISPINPDTVDKATFYTNTLPANKGGSLSSLVDLISNDSIKKDQNFKVGLNMLFADLSHKVMFKDKFVVKYSFRKSVAPFFDSPVYKSYAEKVFQNTEFQLNRNENKFDFWDGALVVENMLNEKNKLKLSGIIIRNDLNYSNLNDKAKLQNQIMKIDNLGANLLYNSKWSDKFNFMTYFSHSNYKFIYDRNSNSNYNPEMFNKKNNLLENNLNLAVNYIQSSTINHSFGYEWINNRIDHNIKSNNEKFGFNISERNAAINSNALFFKTQINNTIYELNLGARLTNNKYNKSLFEPRINFILKFNENLQLITSFEKRSQFIKQINENNAGDITIENYVWVIAENDLTQVLISNQFNTGLLFKKNKLIIEVDSYIKKVSGITSFSKGVIFSESLNSDSIATIANGYGFTNGLDFSIQKEISKWKFWGSYSFLNAENKIHGLNNNEYFKSNGNIEHSIYLSSSYKFSNLYITLGWLWNSGRPYSELNSTNNILSFNNKNLPSFHSLDLSLLYNVCLNSDYKLKVGLSINNIYNHKVIINKEITRTYATIDDLNRPRYSSTDFYSLGFTPNLFLSYSF